MEILMFSGGVDSLIAWYYLGKPQRLYVNLGTAYSEEEEEHVAFSSPEASSVWRRYHPGWGAYEHNDAHLPMRNLLLTMIAAAEGADTIYLVCQKGEQGIPDRSTYFFQNVGKSMSFHNDRPITVDSVFPHMDKAAMVAWYLQQDLPPEDLVKAFSCYSVNSPCGWCGACWRKFIALEANGVACEDIFKGDIRGWGSATYLSKLDTYSPERQEAMRKVMGW